MKAPVLRWQRPKAQRADVGRSVWERGVSGPGGSAGQPGPRPLLSWLTRGSRSSPCPHSLLQPMWLGAVGVPRGEEADCQIEGIRLSRGFN